MKAEKIKELAR